MLEGLSESGVRALLAEAGRPIRRGGAPGGPAGEAGPGGAQVLLQSGEFDPCTVQTRPSDLLRRRHRVRAVALAAALCVVAGTLAVAAERGCGAWPTRVRRPV
ncbi:hypothetical protein ACN24K_33550 [Streptomyces microflavus]